MEQFCAWFDLDRHYTVCRAIQYRKIKLGQPALFKAADNARLAALVRRSCSARRSASDVLRRIAIVATLQRTSGYRQGTGRCSRIFYLDLHPAKACAGCSTFRRSDIPPCCGIGRTFPIARWTRGAMRGVIKAIVGTHGLKLPKLAMPLRVMVAGETHTPFGRCGADAVPAREPYVHAHGTKSLPVKSEFSLHRPEIYSPVIIMCGSFWGYSSAGRALAWHARGQRFDPAYLHHLFVKPVRRVSVSRLGTESANLVGFLVSGGCGNGKPIRLKLAFSEIN